MVGGNFTYHVPDSPVVAYVFPLPNAAQWQDVSTDSALTQAYGFDKQSENPVLLVQPSGSPAPGHITAYLGALTRNYAYGDTLPYESAAAYLQGVYTGHPGETDVTPVSQATVGEAGYSQPYQDLTEISYTSTDVVSGAPMRFTDIVLTPSTDQVDKGWYQLELSATPDGWPALHAQVEAALQQLQWTGKEKPPGL